MFSEHPYTQRLLGGLLAGYVFFLLLTSPITLWTRVLAVTLPGVTFDHAQGNLWQGRAAAVTFPLGQDRASIKDLRWNFQVSGLLRLEARYRIKIAAVSGDALVGIGWNGVNLHDTDLNFAAGQLASILPLLAPWQPGGEITLQSQKFTLPTGTVPAVKDEVIQVTWKNASVNLTQVQPLGDYRLQMSGLDNGDTALRLETLRGALHLDGSGAYSRRQGLVVKGTASANDHHAALLPVLKLIGNAQADGSYAVSLKLPP